MTSQIAPPDRPRSRGSDSEGSGSRLPELATVVIPLLAVGILALIDFQAIRAIVTATLSSPQAIAIVIGIAAAIFGISALATRFGVHGWAHTAVVLVPLALVGAITVGPYFTQGQELNEALPVALAPAEQDANAAAAPAEEVPDVQAPDEDAQPADAPPAPAPDEPVGAAPAPDEPAAAEPAAAGPRQLSSGSFVGLDNHRATGVAAAIDLGDGSVVVQFQDVDLQNVPDAHVYLVPTAGAQAPTEGAVHISPLKAQMGTHHYEIPADIDLSTGEWTVLVWCEPFRSPVGGATLS